MRAKNLVSRKSKTCDDCKRRKVRCTVPTKADGSQCFNCAMRGTECHFSLGKRLVRPKPPDTEDDTTEISQTWSSSPAQMSSVSTVVNGQSPDSIIASIETTVYDSFQHQGEQSSDFENKDEPVLISGQCDRSRVLSTNSRPGSSGLATFSGVRIEWLSKKLGHGQLRDIMHSLGKAVESKVAIPSRPCTSNLAKTMLVRTLCRSRQKHTTYFEVYFKQVHPQYPFLDRNDFESCARKPALDQFLQQRPEFAALYFGVLALGSLHAEDGAFVQGEGIAWTYFQASQEMLPVMTKRPQSLCSLQAMLTLAIFAQTSCSIELGDMLISETTRMAQMMRYNRLLPTNLYEKTCARTFWVIYQLETFNAFACNRSALIASDDISTPLHTFTLKGMERFSWFHSMVSLAQILSMMYRKLFTVRAAAQSSAVIIRDLEVLTDELEKWRLSVPLSLRPGESIRAEGNIPLHMIVRMHCHYNCTQMALLRTRIHYLNHAKFQTQSQTSVAIHLVQTARMIAEITKYIEIKPHTPIWILAVVPLSAIFVLFDFIVYNPTHEETQSSLKALGMLAGHFDQLDYFTKGSYPSNSVTELVDIARRHVSLKSTEFANKSGYAFGESITNSQTPLMSTSFEPLDQANLAIICPDSMQIVPNAFECDIPLDWGGNTFFPDFLQDYGSLSFTDQAFPPLNKF